MEKMKKCPYCGEEILAAATKCKYCKEWLNETQDNSSSVSKVVELKKETDNANFNNKLTDQEMKIKHYTYYLKDAIPFNRTILNVEMPRARYWISMAFLYILSTMISIIFHIEPDWYFKNYSVFHRIAIIALILYVLINSILLTRRRLNDIGKSGWMILLSIIPIVGPIWLLILLCKKGKSNVEVPLNKTFMVFTILLTVAAFIFNVIALNTI